MKKLLALLLALVMTMPMVACGGNNSDSGNDIGVSAPSEDIAMQYITVDDAFAVLEDDSYIFFDVRKAADYQTSHIPGAEGYDMDAAKEGDFAAGVATLNPAIKDLDKNIIVICYSGKRYAQAATNVLYALGYDMSKVFTLEGGYTAWTEKHADAVEVGTEIVAPAEDVAMQYITPAEAAELLNNEEYVFLDVRQNADFNTATIPGAKGYDMHAAMNGDFAAGVATMQVATRDNTKKLIVICYSGKRYAQATTNVLYALGYDMSMVYTLEGGFTAWSKAYPDQLQVGIVAPAENVAMQYITPEEALALLESEEYVFFDVRKAADYAAGHIPGAKSYDMDAAKEGNFNAGVATMQAATRNLDKNIIVICYTGNRYAQATTNVLSAMGYDMSKVFTLEGGFNAWSEAYGDKIEN